MGGGGGQCFSAVSPSRAEDDDRKQDVEELCHFLCRYRRPSSARSNDKAGPPDSKGVLGGANPFCQ